VNALVERVAERYLIQHPVEAARILDALDAVDVASAVAALNPSERAAVLCHVNADVAADTVATLDDDTATETLIATDSVRVARWLALLGGEARDRLVKLLPPRHARDVTQALDYPPGSAGALMDPGVIPFDAETSIDDVLDGLRRLKNRRVTDVMVCKDERLIGVVPLQELLVAPHDKTLGPLARRDAPAVHAMATHDEVVDLLERHRLASLPVVDLDRRLLGIIRYDALVRAAQQAAADDLQKMVGAGSEERALSSASLAVKSRLPWLFINLLTAFAAAAVVGIFDATIAEVTALAVLLPVVAGQSGNTGAQALAVTSRGLALREIRVGQWWRVVRKEIAAAAANGVLVATVTSLGVLLWSGSLALCAVIGTSMIISMVLAAAAGALIPVLLTAIGRDPATASSIILTTVTDITGFFSFLGLATVMKEYLL
jgi:magnesium transporter